MGGSADGMLAYGYNLGGAEEWEIQETDEYGGLELDWFDETGSDDGEDRDFVAVAERRLLAAAGFTETDMGAEGYFTRRKEARAAVGVVFETYGSPVYSMHVLATKVITVNRGYMEPVDMAGLATAPYVHGWPEKLTAALTMLGITPKQEKPGWILCSWVG